MMFERVEKLIEEKIRPYMQGHSGDVKLLSVENGVVSIRLLGQCSGCPSAKYTVEDVIEASLKEELPEIKQVIVEQGVSEELLQMARKILNR
ncbi:MAG: NifU family protein [Clostridium lundense]|nr:nitrogen fixation protein NifU [Clostridium sp. HMP27]MBE6066527.1 NifU family protein [Clostridium lundense]